MKLRGFYERCARWESTTIKLLGIVEILFAVALFLPSFFALYYNEDPLPFLIPIVPLAILGSVQFLMFYPSKNFKAVNGLLLMTMAWVLMFAICSAPYLIIRNIPLTGIDSVFEAVSSLTTTGLSVMGDLNNYPTSLLIWRSMTQWIGGITVVIIFVYFLPMVGFGRTLFQNELAGSGTSNFTQKATTAAVSFMLIYFVLSAINFIVLIILGVHPVEAMCLMFTTISTGGLLIFNGNLSVYSDWVQWVTVIFMFLGGTNFYLHYRAIYLRQKRAYWRNAEFRMMIIWFVVISAIVFLLLVQSGWESGGNDVDYYERVKSAVFTTVSLGTTTGFYIDDFTSWPSQCMILLMIVAVIGTSSSSTSGGIKFSRIRIIYEYIKNGFSSVLHPNTVNAVKMDGESVGDSTITSALVVFMMFLVTLIIGAVVCSIYGFNMVDSLGISISVVSNGGMGFGNFGPTGSYVGLEDSLKAILALLMWVGRLEIVTAVILMTPGFWKEIWLNSRSRRLMRKSLIRARKI